jgi:hypothetical protein
MTPEEIQKFCEEQPAAADSLIAAFRHVVAFRNSRGAMLRRLGFDPQAAAFIKDFNKTCQS